MLCKILIINMLDYKFKRFIFNIKITIGINGIFIVSLILLALLFLWMLTQKILLLI